MNALTGYLEQYALLSLEKQEKFSRLAGEHVMELDFEAGLMRLSGNRAFPFQVLGTESDNTLTWLWAWADEQSELPEDLLQASRRMRDWGAAAGVRECAIPSVDLDDADGHVLSLVASEVCGASCYYHDPYDGGASFLLLFGDEIDRQAPFDAAGFARRFSDLISLYELNHRKAVLSYLQRKGLPFSGQGPIILGALESGERLEAEFDRADRLVSLNGKALHID